MPNDGKSEAPPRMVTIDVTGPSRRLRSWRRALLVIEAGAMYGFSFLLLALVCVAGVAVYSLVTGDGAGALDHAKYFVTFLLFLGISYVWYTHLRFGGTWIPALTTVGLLVASLFPWYMLIEGMIPKTLGVLIAVLSTLIAALILRGFLGATAMADWLRLQVGVPRAFVFGGGNWKRSGTIDTDPPFRSVMPGIQAACISPLVVIGWMAGGLGSHVSKDSPLEIDWGGFAVTLIGAVFATSLATAGYSAWNRWSVKRALERFAEDTRRTILLLRPFEDDSLMTAASRLRAGIGEAVRFEENIVKTLWSIGPVITVGDPWKTDPVLGAARVHVGHDPVRPDAWHEPVEDLISRAGMVTMVAGRSESLRWELSQVCARGMLDRLIVLVPPLTGESLLARWGLFLEKSAGVLPPACSSSLGSPETLLAIAWRADGTAIRVESRTRKNSDYDIALMLLGWLLAYPMYGEKLRFGPARLLSDSLRSDWATSAPEAQPLAASAD